MYKDKQITLILTCAGKGARAGFNKNKLLIPINGETALKRTLRPFLGSGLINQYIITASADDFEEVKKIAGNSATVVLGGDTRSASVKNALKVATGDIVLIHDGARPFVSTKVIKACIDGVIKNGSAITAIPSCDTVLKSDGGYISDYLGKEGLYNVQTPQGFYTKDIVKAYDAVGDKSFPDDGCVYKEVIGIPHICEGDRKNVKLTYKEDFDSLKENFGCRVGVGFDCHKLTENRKLVLGGVTIPHTKGLLGHSDADVLTHAVMDAILSALSMRDIGYHFSDKDPAYKDADSMELLKTVLFMIDEKGYKVDSVSATVMAEKPKLLPHIPAITSSLANALGISIEKVGIGATTLEGLGFVGREEGICTQASAVLIEKN